MIRGTNILLQKIEISLNGQYTMGFWNFSDKKNIYRMRTIFCVQNEKHLPKKEGENRLKLTPFFFGVRIKQKKCSNVANGFIYKERSKVWLLWLIWLLPYRKREVTVKKISTLSSSVKFQAPLRLDFSISFTRGHQSRGRKKLRIFSRGGEECLVQ